MSDEHKISSLREVLQFAAQQEIEQNASALAASFATARQYLSIAFVLEQHGFAVEEFGGGLRSLCPFHEGDGKEHSPSLSIFGENLERFNCWGCQAKGDVTDIVKHFEPALHADGESALPLFRRLQELITAQIDSDWAGPKSGASRPKFDVIGALDLVKSSQVDTSDEMIKNFVEAKAEQRGREAWPFTPEFLRTNWSVGTMGSWLIMPYYDEEQNLISYKRWAKPTQPRMSASGASYEGRLYGDWRPDNGGPVLLCEGESDTWYADWHVGEEFRVLGLPTGVGSATTRAESLKGRTVFLAFDGDDPGRGACKRWAEALETQGATIRILPIPAGKDLSTAGDIRALIGEARTPVAMPSGIDVSDSGYVRFDKNSNRSTLANFSLRPMLVLHGDGSTAFECQLRPGGQAVTITDNDLSSESKLHGWATRYGRSFYGNTKDARLIAGLLQAESIYLPSSKLVVVAGLHGNTFVWQGGKIGPDSVKYLPPTADAHLETKLSSIKPGKWDPSVVEQMRNIQRREITDPLIAWLAAAPLRTRFSQFPFVAVSGHAGAGKTVTTETLIRAFSGSHIEQSFGSTPHAFRSVFAATNAFPVQLEEFRRTGRSDTLEDGKNLLRDAYDMTASAKGGMRGNWAELSDIVPCAPVVVTGEDVLTEGSHADRMIPLWFDAAHQNAEAFERLRSTDEHGFAHAYLSWLSRRMTNGELSAPLPFVAEGPKELKKRQRENLGILRCGWELIKAFLSESELDLGDPDFSGVIKAMLDANKHTPIEQAIVFCLQENDAANTVFMRSGEIWIQPERFFLFITDPRRSSLFPMPGNAQSIRQYLFGKFQGVERTDRKKTYVVVPYDAVLATATAKEGE